jgi:DNA modification methylase
LNILIPRKEGGKDMLLFGDCVKVMHEQLEPESFHTCVTSPPYWGLRDYGVPPSDWPEVTFTPMPGLPSITVPEWTGCLGLEPAPEMFVSHMVLVFREVWRVLRKDGTLWMNFGDSYASKPQSNDDKWLDPKNARKGGSRCRIASNTGIKTKDLIGIPWRVAFALQADGWWLRMDNIWNKPNPMPESVQDRPTKSHEYMFLLSKSDRYYYDKDAIKEACVQDEWANGFRGGSYTENSTFNNSKGGKRRVRGNFKVPTGWDTEPGGHGTIHRTGRSSGNKERVYGDGRGRPGSHLAGSVPWEGTLRNKRSVWTVATQPFPEAHFATFPEKLIEPCILAGAPVGGHVLDPFGGSGTTMKVALENQRECTLIDINPDYIKLQEKRTAVVQTKLL